MRECYPIIIGNLYQRPPHSRSFARPRDTGTGTLHGRERINTRDYALANAARFRLGRRDENGVGFSRQLSAKGDGARLVFVGVCPRARLRPPKVLVAGVSVARAAARRFHERARGPSRRLPPRARHGSVRLPPARGRRGRRRRRLPRLQGSRTSTRRERPSASCRGSLPRGPAPASRPRRGDRRGPIPRTASGGRDVAAAATAPPRPSTRTAHGRPRRRIVRASSKPPRSKTAATARATKKRERTRNYAPSRTPSRRDRIAPIVAPKRDVPAAPAGAALRAGVRRRPTADGADLVGRRLRPSPTSSRTTSSTEPSMATARWVRRRRSRR